MQGDEYVECSTLFVCSLSGEGHTLRANGCLSCGAGTLLDSLLWFVCCWYTLSECMFFYIMGIFVAIVAG